MVAGRDRGRHPAPTPTSTAPGRKASAITRPRPTTAGAGARRAAYLRPARNRQNLTVVTKAHATRILIEGGRAVGVEYRTPQGNFTAAARGEIIVSGGVYGSPQLLQLSGLGPADLLSELGIPVVRDMPGVGANLHDHFNTYLVWRCSQPVTLNDLATSPPRKLMAGVQYAFSRSGQLSNAGMYAGAFVRSDPRLEQPDLQINMSGWSAHRAAAHRHQAAPVLRLHPSARCICARTAAARCGSRAPTRWRRRRSASISSPATTISRR